MTQEDKELLLKDLCARLPYGVVCADKYVDEKFINKWNVLAIDATFGDEFSQVCISNCEVTYGYKTSITNIKPYLFPLSSMTEEQIEELKDLISQETNILIEQLRNDDCGIDCGKYHFHTTLELEWLLKNHFDFRGLIEKGLAVDATGKDIY